MKLRNKKTGEVGNLQPYGEDGKIWVWIGNMSKPEYRYKSLAELNEEWEDHEEPKEYWYISEQSAIVKMLNKPKDIPNFVEGCLSIGNLFETKEEAEKAVKKLKAWKRLKDKGFRFNAWYGGSKNIDWEITSLENEAYIPRQICDDIDLLFGGEE